MSFDSPVAGPGPRWTGDGSLRPRVPVPEDDPAPAHRSVRDGAPTEQPPRARTVEVGGVAAVLASPFRRLLGMAIDRTLSSLLMAVLLAVSGAEPGPISFEGIVAAQILTRGWDMIFFSQGWTPGSRLVRVRIIRLVDGGVPGARWGFVRAAGAVISETVLVGYLWAFWDSRRQTWHDKFAGTVVIEAPR
ncbi:MAG: RDD family protein [Chloroflexi bacterium]|nr:RDD family protein [Chloroflexota bacterium]